MLVDLQTLIAYGNKLSENEKTLSEYNIKEGNFIVIMIAKVTIPYLLILHRQKSRKLVKQHCHSQLLLYPLQ
jgi:hypothetical protein